MPVTIGGTNVPGDSARLFQWQMVHYLVHGGPNDPVIQSASPPTQASPGYLGWGTVVTLPPLPGTQTPPAVPLPRVQQIGSTGTVSTTTLSTNNGGIYIGTIPQGSWIESVEVYSYIAFAGGTSLFGGVFYAPADTQGAAPGFQPATLYSLAYLIAFMAGSTLYSTETSAGTTAFTTASIQKGPGTGTAGAAQLASLGDIDLYYVVGNTSGQSTLTNGSVAVRVKFTGLEG